MSGRFSASSTSAFVGLTSTAGRVIWYLFVLANTVFIALSLHDYALWWPPVIALALVFAASSLLLVRRPDPLPMLFTWAIVATVPAASAMVAFQLPPSGWPGFASWHIGAITWMLLGLALRGRIVFAWVGAIAMITVTALWGAWVGRSPVDILNLHIKEVGVLLIGTLFSVALAAMTRRVDALNQREFEAVSASAALAAAQREREARLVELREVAVGPLLEIQSGAEVDRAAQIGYAVAEARLRDSLRARSLHRPVLVAAASAARGRGVEVALLDDRTGALDAAALDSIAARVSGLLEPLEHGRLTVRLLPEGRGTAVSIVIDDGETTRRLALDGDGNTVAGSS